MKKFNPAQWQPCPTVYKPPIRNPKPQTRNSKLGATSSDVEIVVSRIERTGADIAPTYADWLALGFALASEFGESGREYYHRTSVYYSDYKPETTEKQYDKCLCSRGHGVTIKTFFQLAKNAGININTRKYDGQ